MSLIVIDFDSRYATQRTVDSINAELASVATIVRLCGIPESFKAQLEAVDPVRTGIPHDFLLRVGWEHQCVDATLSGWEWRQMSPDERIDRIRYWVEHACRELLRGVMADRRECAGKREVGR